MDLVRFRRIKALFELLSGIPAEDRRRLIEDVCIGDPDERDIVIRLLETSTDTETDLPD